MTFPSRKERRKNKTTIKSNLFVLSIFFIIVVLNLPLILAQNLALLSFTLPLSLLILYFVVFKKKKGWLLINVMLLIIIYISYLEVTYRFWAQK